MLQRPKLSFVNEKSHSFLRSNQPKKPGQLTASISITRHKDNLMESEKQLVIIFHETRYPLTTVLGKYVGAEPSIFRVSRDLVGLNSLYFASSATICRSCWWTPDANGPAGGRRSIFGVLCTHNMDRPFPLTTRVARVLPHFTATEILHKT